MDVLNVLNTVSNVLDQILKNVLFVLKIITYMIMAVHHVMKDAINVLNSDTVLDVTKDTLSQKIQVVRNVHLCVIHVLIQLHVPSVWKDISWEPLDNVKDAHLEVLLLVHKNPLLPVCMVIL